MSTRTLDGGRAPITSMWSKQFYETDPSRGFVRGYTLQFDRGIGPANEAITSVAAGRLPWGRDHHRVYRELFDHRVRIGVACEDLPEEHNRVTLDPVLKDSNGIPAPRIDYTISENTRRMMEHGIARAEEILTAAGATRLYASRTVLNSPGHLLGTARMGDDPGALGGECLGPLPRREEPVHRRWQHLGDGRRREPDLDDPGPGALHRRPDEAAAGDAVRLIGDLQKHRHPDRSRAQRGAVEGPVLLPR